MRNLGCLLGAVLALVFVSGAGAANFVLKDTITASDVASQDEFGGRFGNMTSFSTDGSTLLIGTRQADCAAGPNCGAAYVFVRTPAGEWVQQAKLTGPDSAPGDQLTQVALSGDGNVALVGAAHASCAAGSECGAVYFFARSGSTWSFQQKLTASDAGAGDRFGGALAISSDGTVALVGAFVNNCGPFPACGSVYAFERSGSVWTERQQFSGDPNSNVYFGGTVVLSGDGNTALIVGDVFGGGLVAGRAYVFTRSGGVWSFQTKLAPLASPFAFAFTMDISADGDVALIHEDNFASEDFVYVFTRTGTSWSLETRIPNASSPGTGVAAQLALSDDGETAVIKSTRVCSGSLCQVAHLFRRNQGAWNRLQTLQLSGFVDFLNDGSVDISGDAQTVLVADPGASCASGPSCGVAHIFGPFLPLEDIPTASHFGLALLALLLAVSGARMLARRHPV